MDPIAELIITYNELNSSIVEELDEEPSPLEFMRFVARNTPFVVRKGAAQWIATKTWTADYLNNFLQDQHVNVAVTPKGYAYQKENSENSIRCLVTSRERNNIILILVIFFALVIAMPTLPQDWKMAISSSRSLGKRISLFLSSLTTYGLKR